MALYHSMKELIGHTPIELYIFELSRYLNENRKAQL